MHTPILLVGFGALSSQACIHSVWPKALAHEASYDSRGGFLIECPRICTSEFPFERLVEHRGLIHVIEDFIDGRFGSFASDAEPLHLLYHPSASSSFGDGHSGGQEGDATIIERAVAHETFDDGIDFSGLELAASEAVAELLDGQFSAR